MGTKMAAMLRPPLDQTGKAALMDKAQVLKRDANKLLLLTAGGTALWGRQAVGCLLAPEVGDTVLILRDPEAAAYVLNVLERPEPGGRIAIQGNVTLESEDGTLRLQGRHVELSGTESALLEAPQVDFKGVRGRVVFHGFSMLADRLEARMRILSTVAETMDILAERMMQRLRDCFRRVERMDETRAGLVNVRADEMLNIRAGDASIIAENDVKVDGATIRLG
jgi:hypothetical protein